MKISRSTSSSSAVSLVSSDTGALSSNSWVSSLCLPRNAIWRRIRSIALLRPTLTSHAGGSAAGQRSSATAKASCSASSARSKSPTRRIRVASARPASSRNIFSISVGVMECRLGNTVIPGWSEGPDPESRDSGFASSMRPGMTASPSIINPDRPDLDRTEARARNLCGDGQGCVEILGLDQIVAAELLAGFRERAIGGQRLAVTDAHGGRGGGRLQPVAGLEIAALDDALREGTIFLQHLLRCGGVDFAVLDFVLVDHQQILHLVTPLIGLIAGIRSNGEIAKRHLQDNLF